MDLRVAEENEKWAREYFREIVRHIVLEYNELFVSIRGLTRILSENFKLGHDRMRTAAIIDIMLEDGLIRYYVKGVFLIYHYALERGYVSEHEYQKWVTEEYR